MRYLRTALAAAALTAAFIVTSTASAQINSFQVVGDTAQLGPEGATVAVPVIANCSAGFFGTTRADVRQSTGKLLNTGFGFGENFVCTGTDQLFSVTVFASAFPYKQGKASVIAGMTATDPVTFQNFDTRGGAAGNEDPKVGG